MTRQPSNVMPANAGIHDFLPTFRWSPKRLWRVKLVGYAQEV
jgi:hypothetical protein